MKNRIINQYTYIGVDHVEPAGFVEICFVLIVFLRIDAPLFFSIYTNIKEFLRAGQYLSA